jgi:hypothetical protein
MCTGGRMFPPVVKRPERQTHHSLSYNAKVMKAWSYTTIPLTFIKWYSVKYRDNYWLRQYATSRKVTGLIPDEVIGFFNWPNHSSLIMALGSTSWEAET